MVADQQITIAVVAGDPGGANALRPVIAQLQSLGIHIRLYPYAQAVTLWSDWPTFTADVPDLVGVDVLLTATSVNEKMLELAWIAAAHELSVPSLAVIDFWSNYGERFLPARLNDQTNSLQRLPAIWPDWIAVHDEYAEIEASQFCHPRRGMVVVGQTLHDVMSNIPLLSKGDKAAIRSACRVKQDEVLLVYISQPLQQMAEQTKQKLLNNEQQVLQNIERTLAKLNLPIALRVRLHPRENHNSYPDLAHFWPNTMLEQQQKPYELLQAADIVVGINSMLLLEACYLGCKVISYQSSGAPDVLPSNRFGWSRLCRDCNELAQAISEVVNNQWHRATPEMQCGASMNIVEQLVAMAKQGKKA